MSDLRKAAEMALKSLEQDPVPLNAINNAKMWIRQALAQEEKPPVKSYCGGKPNYCTPEQEPFGYFHYDFEWDGWVETDPGYGKPLYNTPPKREWVGLTDEDFYGQSELQVMAMKYAEAKLKEKNT